jgi:hypothetical protein
VTFVVILFFGFFMKNQFFLHSWVLSLICAAFVSPADLSAARALIS